MTLSETWSVLPHPLNWRPSFGPVRRREHLGCKIEWRYVQIFRGLYYRLTLSKRFLLPRTLWSQYFSSLFRCNLLSFRYRPEKVFHCGSILDYPFSVDQYIPRLLPVGFVSLVSCTYESPSLFDPYSVLVFVLGTPVSLHSFPSFLPPPRLQPVRPSPV